MCFTAARLAAVPCLSAAAPGKQLRSRCAALCSFLRRLMPLPTVTLSLRRPVHLLCLLPSSLPAHAAGKTYLSSSTDKGRTWSRPSSTYLPNPNSPLATVTIDGQVGCPSQPVRLQPSIMRARKECNQGTCFWHSSRPDGWRGGCCRSCSENLAAWLAARDP